MEEAIKIAGEQHRWRNATEERGDLVFCRKRHGRKCRPANVGLSFGGSAKAVDAYNGIYRDGRKKKMVGEQHGFWRYGTNDGEAWLARSPPQLPQAAWT